MRSARTYLALLAAGALAAFPAGAQDEAAGYPNKPIRIICSVPPGGGVDTVTRIVGEGLRQRFGQPVVIENRGGVAGNLGAEAVYAAEPDGYTLLAAQPAPLTVNPLFYKKLNYDPAKFEPVSIMTTVPLVLLVRPDFPARTATEFIAYAESNPGKINYASQGIGTSSHLTAELFQRATGSKIVHVPYKGTGPALNDLIASHVDMIFMELAAAIELHRGGKARILAAATLERIPALPDIPTFDEAGVKKFEAATWNAIAAPPKTPAAIVAKLSRAIADVLKEPEVQAHFQRLSLRTVGATPAESAAFIRRDTQVWGDLIRSLDFGVQ